MRGPGSLEQLDPTCHSWETPHAPARIKDPTCLNWDLAQPINKQIQWFFFKRKKAKSNGVIVKGLNIIICSKISLLQNLWYLLIYRFKKVHRCSVTNSCLTLCHPLDCRPPGCSVHGISQAKILEWIAISYSRESSHPRDWTHVSCIGRWVLQHWATQEVIKWDSDPKWLSS